MKIYKDYQFASIMMLEDKPFLEALRKISPSIILETGTYLGTGSTKMLASLNPKKLYTIECSYANYLQAKENLKEFPFIECIHGLSVDLEEAKKFIIINPEIFQDDVFIDDDNPVEFYTNEIMGMLNGDEKKEDMKESILLNLLPEIADENPLILLDSAGGIGVLEFITVRDIMGNRPYTIVLDDTHHVKHYRSKLSIQKNPMFKIVYNDDIHGRLIALHNPKEDTIYSEVNNKNIYVILGRFGDIFMVCRQLKVPSIICCMPIFSKIVYELFPQHEVFELNEQDLTIAASVCKVKYPKSKIIICQQDGQDRKLMKPFRSFQSFQEYYAKF